MKQRVSRQDLLKNELRADTYIEFEFDEPAYPPMLQIVILHLLQLQLVVLFKLAKDALFLEKDVPFKLQVPFRQVRKSGLCAFSTDESLRW